MKNKKIIGLIVFIALAFSISRLGVTASDYKKGIYVSHIVDGDTVELSNGEKVRYIGIDTPETREKKGSVWSYNPMPYGEEAKAYNQALVGGKSVTLEFDVQKKDKYDRLLAYVYIEDKMVNLEMVKQGYAMIYTFPPNVKYVEAFLKAQQEARENQRGLWKGLEQNIIPASLARENLGTVRMVEADVTSTYLSEKVLILNCRDNFKVAIFRNNLEYFPKEVMRSPDSYFRHKSIKVYGVIKEYKDACEIILHDSSQIEVLQ